MGKKNRKKEKREKKEIIYRTKEERQNEIKEICTIVNNGEQEEY